MLKISAIEICDAFQSTLQDAMVSNHRRRKTQLMNTVSIS